MCNRKLNKKVNRRRRRAVIVTTITMLCLVVMMSSMSAFAFVDDQNKPDKTDVIKDNGANTHAIEGETSNPDTAPALTRIRTYNNTPDKTHTMQVTENGVTYTISYLVRHATVLPEEISGMDSDQALEYIANKSMTFYTDRNVTNIPDIVYGRDYFVRVNGSTNINPETLLGSYKLEIANNTEFNNAASTTVTIGNNNNNGNGGSTNVDNIDNTNRTNSNVNNTGISAVRSTASRLSGSVRSIGRASLGSRAEQGNATSVSGANTSSSVSADSDSDIASSKSSDTSSAAAEMDGGGNSTGSNRTAETVANALTAGAGVGAFWLTILIISDIKLLLWYKKLKEVKKKSAV